MESNSAENNPNLPEEQDDDQWCFTWMANNPNAAGNTRAALVRGNKWQRGTTITISFLDGSQALRDRVQKIAEEWTVPGLANLRFSFIDNPPARTDIRISFRFKGSWSALGTTCKSITDATQPTMNFGTLRETTSDADAKRVVLHEFGHAIGLIHEHQHPAGGIQWNRDRIIQDLSGPPNNWTLEQIEHNMFEPYSKNETNHTNQIDKLSIMMYPIPAKWTLDGFSTVMNRELSQTDKTFIRQEYF